MYAKTIMQEAADKNDLEWDNHSYSNLMAEFIETENLIKRFKSFIDDKALYEKMSI